MLKNESFNKKNFQKIPGIGKISLTNKKIKVLLKSVDFFTSCSSHV